MLQTTKHCEITQNAQIRQILQVCTRCEGGEAAPVSLLCRVPRLGLGAGLPQRQGEMLGGDPGWTQQSHHVQTQRQKDAEQSDELEGSEHIHLVHGHLLITGYGAAGQSRTNELAGGPRASSPTIAFAALCVSSCESLRGDFRLDWVFKIIAFLLGHVIIIFKII